MTLEQLKEMLTGIPEDRRVILGPVLLNRYNTMNPNQKMPSIEAVLALDNDA